DDDAQETFAGRERLKNSVAGNGSQFRRFHVPAERVFREIDRIDVPIGAGDLDRIRGSGDGAEAGAFDGVGAGGRGDYNVKVVQFAALSGAENAEAVGHGPFAAVGRIVLQEGRGCSGSSSDD